MFVIKIYVFSYFWWSDIINCGLIFLIVFEKKTLEKKTLEKLGKLWKKLGKEIITEDEPVLQKKFNVVKIIK